MIRLTLWCASLIAVDGMQVFIVRNPQVSQRA